MDFKVILAPRAIGDLERIVRYIAPHNPPAAERFGHALIGKTKLLAQFPELGRKVPEMDDPRIRELIFKSYRIVYRVDHEKKAVEVSRFWHAAQGTPVLPDPLSL